MRRRTLAVLFLLGLICLLLIPGPGAAQSPPPVEPRTPHTPIRPQTPDLRGTDAVTRLTTAPQALPALKAVLIVGPIDGDYGEWTTDEKANMELAAAELEANGVTVHRFYAPNNRWSDITAAAEGAHFLFYRGHGVYWSPYPQPTVGGFALSHEFVSSDDIRQDLHLAPNAIVMLYGCFTAGTSGSDNGDIGIEEATRRVAQYSDPFFDIGAVGYYADWFGDAFQKYVRYLFQGQTLGETYEMYFDFNPSTVYRTTHPDHPQMAMWLDKDYWSGYWQYNNAFAGLPEETLSSLFAASELGGLPGEVTFFYSIADDQFMPSAYQGMPLNVGNEEILTWSLTSEGEWFTVTPGSGSTPATFSITPTTLDDPTPGQVTGAVTVTVTDPPEVEGSPHRLDVTLGVFDSPLQTYLPLTSR